MERVFFGEYPKQWEKQILNATAKHGHTSKTPKLRGIGIGQVLARTYDIIMDQRFNKWYIPNREQSAFCSGKGCLLPLFSVFLLLHYALKENIDLCMGLMDYEKAFDFSNRAKIVDKLMERGCGRAFTEAILKMLTSTTYIPSVNNKLCGEITTSYGVTQGRNSSPNLYSFYVSDMPRCTDVMPEKDFIDPHSMPQLADDTAIFSVGLPLLGNKMNCLLEYSDEIYQVPNIPKTVFCQFAEHPHLGHLTVNNEAILSSVDQKKGHPYLGVKVIPTNDPDKIVKFNINERFSNWAKFYAWLQINEETPIEMKLIVLDSCLFNSILWGIESFGDLRCIEEKLRVSEQKALRAVLKVKKGTSIDLLYNELKRPDIIAAIRNQQHNFFEKVIAFHEDEAVVKSVLRICRNTEFVAYYHSHLYVTYT